ncbi:hypothetical protein FHS51_000065 [Sphingobium wenxiniae]|nr:MULTISPECIES: hypothetical protein [Sphingobium]MBB6189862.1 hypothetical protein [Sphingobium wenxiniae]WRD76982.1 hypothetical protein QQ987_02235 [Sphingobium baderi]
MSFKTHSISSLSHRRLLRSQRKPIPAGILSTQDLRRIVAEMLG